MYKLSNNCTKNLNKYKFKGTVIQTEKALINDRLRVSKLSRKLCIPTTYIFARGIFYFPRKFLNSFYCLFCFIDKTLRINNLKTRTAINAKISVFFICVKAIIYLLLYNLHEWTFKLIKNLIVMNQFGTIEILN